MLSRIILTRVVYVGVLLTLLTCLAISWQQNSELRTKLTQSRSDFLKELDQNYLVISGLADKNSTLLAIIEQNHSEIQKEKDRTNDRLSNFGYNLLYPAYAPEVYEAIVKQIDNQLNQLEARPNAFSDDEYYLVDSYFTYLSNGLNFPDARPSIKQQIQRLVDRYDNIPQIKKGDYGQHLIQEMRQALAFPFRS